MISMNTLVDLPEELIQQAFSEDLPRTDLLSLCGVSRQFNRIATPLLYRHVSLRKPFSGLRSLSINLLSNQKLASYVQRFSILSPWTNRDTTPSHDPVLYAVFRSAIDRLASSPDEAKAWANDLTQPMREDAFLTALIPNLPNLEQLDVINPTNMGSWWPRIAGFGCVSSFGQGPIMSPKLQRVTLVGDEERCTHWPNPQPVTFPSLHRVGLHTYIRPSEEKRTLVHSTGNMTSWGFQRADLEAFIQERMDMKVDGRLTPLPIKHLEIGRARALEVLMLYGLITQIASLETVVFHAECGAIDIPGIVLALSTHDTLIHLTLDCTKDSGVMCDGLDMRSLTSLQHLTASSDYLCTLDYQNGFANFLPLNITTLTWTKAESMFQLIVGELIRMLGRYKDYVPQLKSVNVQGKITDQHYLDRLLEAKRMADRQGIGFRVSHVAVWDTHSEDEEVKIEIALGKRELRRRQLIVGNKEDLMSNEVMMGFNPFPAQELPQRMIYTGQHPLDIG